MSDSPATQPRILIVDDEAAHRGTLTTILQAEYNLLLATSEDEARAAILENTPSLILLDTDLKGVDGYAICERLGAAPATSAIPVILLTEKMDSDNEARALAIGAADYLLKPFNPPMVIARVRTQIRLQQLVASLAQTSPTDGLTQVMNRRTLLERIPKEIARCRRVEAPISLIVLDIDYFRKFNDRYGEKAGDACLKRVAKILTGIVSRPADQVARYDGESFAIVLPDTDILGASVIAEAACAAVQAEQIEHAESPVSEFVSISLGVVCSQPGDERTLNELFTAADDALYRAKLAGRNGVALTS